MLLDEEFGRRRQHRHVAGIDDAAVGDALALAQIAVERQRRACETEARLEGQIELIDIAGADFLLHLSEPLDVGRPVPGASDIGEVVAAAARMGRQPALDLALRHGLRLLVEPEPQQRDIAPFRHQRPQLRLQDVAEFVGEKPRRMQPARNARFDSGQGVVDIVRIAGRDGFDRVGEKQRRRTLARAVVEQHERLSDPRRPGGPFRWRSRLGGPGRALRLAG